MKKIIKQAFALIAALIAFGPSLSAQEQPQMPPLPVDQNVRIGKLDNGLTYYIRHNEKPKGQADFYIAQKVGSILEEENQRGLAHFLEHMCFNGTKSFPGNSMISWLESVGVKFGYNLNAYTSVDETVYYMSNVPVAKTSVQDTCLLVLHDWANDLLLEPAEIDKERGVIHEEWRRSMVGQMRILENLLPTMYPDSRYGHRLPIGTMEVVDNFAPQALRDYYETWYRPDQQGIIVVGDIDVNYIENKIKEMFSSIEMPADAKTREYFPVPDTPGTIYAIGRDKEQTNGIVELIYKQDVLPAPLKSTMAYYIQDYVTDMIVSMMDSRFDEMSKNPESPFAQAGLSYGNMLLAKTKDNLELIAVAKGNDVRPAFEAAYRELLRAVRGGFTQSEYDRARKEYLSRLETSFNDRENRENGSYCREYVRNFVDNEPIPGIDYEHSTMNMIAPSIPLQAINQTLAELVKDDNRVLLAMMPENEVYYFPTEKDFADIIAKVDGETIEPFVDQVKSEPLIPNLPAPGKIVSEKADSQWGATELVLSNGVKVIVKPTTFKQDEIVFDATARGGLVSVPDTEAASMIFLPYALSQAGLGDYSNSDLQKYTAGKQVKYSYDFENYQRSISGETTPRDLPTLMELLYMAFTNVNMTEDEFAAAQNMFKGIIHNQEQNPQYIFSSKLSESSFKSPRRRQISSEIIEKADRKTILDIAHKMTANAADYTFVFAGNIDIETFRPLVEQYIATLPTPKNASLTEFEYNPDLGMITGKTESTFSTKMETPQTWVFLAQFGEMPYTPKDRYVAYIAGEILGNRLLETVRENMGATYSIGASSQLSRMGKPNNATIQSAFPMKPEMKKEVLDYIAKEISNMTSDVKPEEVSKQVEYLVKNANEDLEKNGSWAGAIAGWSLNGVDTFNGSVDVIQSITPADIQDYMKKLIGQGNYRVVTLDPEQ